MVTSQQAPKVVSLDNRAMVGRVIRAGVEYRALQLVITAYREMIQDGRFNSEWYENRFSAVLKGYIKKRCMPFSRQTKKIWHVEREEYNDSEAVSLGESDPNEVPRIDIVVYSWSVPSCAERRFPFECKRIAENDSDLIRLYVEQGVTRYLDDDKDYGGGGHWGGMLAYAIEGDVGAIVVKLNGQIDRQLGGAPKHEHLQIHSRIADFDAIFSSRHYFAKIDGYIKLTHLFLNFHTRSQANVVS